jgi:leucyl aminopeptidase (aminopeptidase T)
MKIVELVKVAKQLVEVNTAVKPGEDVCIVTDTSLTTIAEAVACAANAAGAETIMTVMTPRWMHGVEPPKIVAAAMSAADVIFAPTTYSITHTDATRQALKSGGRALIMREITEDTMLHGAATADPREIHVLTTKIAEKLTMASRAIVTSPNGTNIQMSLEGRKARVLSGLVTGPGEMAAFPDGEAPIVPVEGTADGLIVVEHIMDGVGLLEQPIRLRVEKGRVVEIQGGLEAMKLQEIVERADENAVNIAEFAVGTNPRSRLIGNVAESKKLSGSVHFAIGDSKTIGGTIESEIHLDGLVLQPTVELDGRIIVERGKITA